MSAVGCRTGLLIHILDFTQTANGSGIDTGRLVAPIGSLSGLPGSSSSLCLHTSRLAFIEPLLFVGMAADRINPVPFSGLVHSLDMGFSPEQLKWPPGTELDPWQGLA